jgi:hypothetical protein
MMQPWRDLLPDAFPSPAIEDLPGAVLRPRGQRDAAGQRLPGGVVRADDSAADLPVRAGSWLFGGVLLNHFGHVLIETGARLWATDVLAGRGVALDGVLFLRKKATPGRGDGPLPPTSDAVLSVFAPDLPVTCVEVPERVERLFLPEPGITVTPERFVGLPEHWAYFRARAARVPPETPGRDLYVSRSGEGARGGYLFEADIEAALAAEGYRIFHPERHSVADQIAAYRGARRLVSIDGSALHLAAAALGPEARVAILARREFFAWALADQLRRAAGCQVTVIDPRGATYNLAGPMASRRELQTVKGWSSSFVLPDRPRLGEALVAAGFLERRPDWPARGDRDLTEALARASSASGQALLAVPDRLLRLQPHFGAQAAIVGP